MPDRDPGSSPAPRERPAMRGLGADERVILKPVAEPGTGRHYKPRPLARLAGGVLFLAVATVWLHWPTITALLVPDRPSPAARRDRPILTANERHILDHDSAADGGGVTLFRFSANPRILVLDFATLREQGLMLNRTAAFAEKAGWPHDRLMSDAELDNAIRAGGDTPETFYYGHDYGVRTLVRFFALADRDDIHLRAEEEALRAVLRREGWFEPNALAGLISIPAAGADPHVDRRARAAILRHELSHGEYFTNPAYAAFVHRFWTQTLTAAEREAMRRYLLRQGYDSSLEELMENEAQAYLMFTDDTAFFDPAAIGMSPARLAALRDGFYRAMPGGWLRDSLRRGDGP